MFRSNKPNAADDYILTQQLPIKPRRRYRPILVAFILLVILSGLALFILKLPHQAILSKPTIERISETFSLGKNELLPNALIRCRVPESLVKKAITALKDCRFDFRRCKAGDTIRIVTEFMTSDTLSLDRVSLEKITKIEYQRRYDQIYEINFDSNKTTVSMAYKEFEVRTELVKNVISSSLYESVIAAGETPTLAFNFADIFSWEIDFFVETQTGDSFFIAVEKKYDDGKFVSYGRINLVRYKSKVGDFYGIFFEDPKGHRDYYDLNGKSLRKAFLRSPLRYSRISSYFSRARFHPILRIVRPHTGIDYVAPRGTPVEAIGDGIITFAGWKGGYGRLVEIQHGNNYKSRYGHLSGFGKNVRVGRRVSQGQTIGYVGATGLATGPHLHFELLHRGGWVNPLRIIPPRAEPVRSEYLSTFYALRDELLNQFFEGNLLPLEKFTN